MQLVPEEDSEERAIARIEALAAQLAERRRDVSRNLRAGLDVLLRRCFAELEELASSSVPQRALYELERALELELADLCDRDSRQSIAYFEMVSLQVHHPVYVRAVLNYEVSDVAAAIEEIINVREARIAAFLNVLSATEESQQEPRGYRNELLVGSWERNLIKRKKPKS